MLIYPVFAQSETKNKSNLLRQKFGAMNKKKNKSSLLRLDTGQ